MLYHIVLKLSAKLYLQSAVPDIRQTECKEIPLTIKLMLHFYYTLVQYVFIVPNFWIHYYHTFHPIVKFVFLNEISQTVYSITKFYTCICMVIKMASWSE